MIYELPRHVAAGGPGWMHDLEVMRIPLWLGFLWEGQVAQLCAEKRRGRTCGLSLASSAF